MDFSVKVVKEALISHVHKDGRNNMVSSPLSIAALLNILTVGSNGRTLEQLLAFFGSQTLADVKINYSKLASVCADDSSSQLVNGDFEGECPLINLKGKGKGKGKGPLINFVNGAWVNQIYTIKPSFEHVLKSVFNIETIPLDLANKLDESIDEVNSWVKKATNGLIDTIVGRDIIDEEIMIIIANALYFKGTWDIKFDPSMTKDRDFHLLNGEKVLVHFMRGDRKILYFYRSFDTFKVAKLPYQSRGCDHRRFSMHLFLPNERDGLHKLLEEFSTNPSLFLNDKLAVSREKLDNFLIPKFEFSSNFEVSRFMSGLGLELGGLTEMIENRDGSAARFVGVRISQKARITVSEEGTEAAAVTYSLMYGCSLNAPPPPPRPSFVADHPFLFMIREDTSGIPFFIGVVLNPLLD